MLSEPTWAPLTYTRRDLELAPQALEEAAASVQILDVREPAEFDGPLATSAMQS
jgi:rhodanese-related sulfurtransferase